MKVYVKTPARLHLGLIDLGGELGRFYGGLGVAVNSPNVVLEAQESPRLLIKGESTEKVQAFVNLFAKKYRIEPKVALNVKKVIPQHVGLGSGTQLALGVARVLARIFKISAPIEELGKVLERGTISGVGTAIFDKGGFVVEGGVKTKNGKLDPRASFPPIIFREPFPEDWFFVVAIPNVKKGLSGQKEAKAFDSLPSMSSEKAGRISRLIIMSLLPALKERDIKTFGFALTQIQNIVGDCFALAQGGRFSSSPSGECINYMLSHGAFGAGQSSWGPTVYGIVASKEEAKRLCLTTREFLQKSVGGQIFFTSANNRGAYIRTAQGVSESEA